MGIIQKQALRSTVINFIGTGFGTITRLLMPIFLEVYQIGVLGLLDSISGMFRVVFNMGYNLILRKLFPKYRDEENGHGGFLVFGILITLFGSVLAFLSFYLLEDYILESKGDDSKYLKPFLFLIPYIFFFRILFSNIDGYVRMLFKTVIGTFLDGFVTKVLLLISLILFGTALIDFDIFVYLYSLVLVLPGVIIVFYAFFATNKITLPVKAVFGESKKIRSYILFGILGGASSSIIQYVDSLMIYKMMDKDSVAQVGVYSMMFFAAVLIAIPAKSLIKISAVVLSESWAKNDKENILKVYSKSVINLLIIGGYLFIVGWACIDPVLELLPNYKTGKYVFFFLGLAKLVELGTGVNVDIIETSEKYKYNTFFNVILAALVFVFNYIFIKNYGIVGAAFASFLAMLIINILRAALLKVEYQLWPFDFKVVKVIVIIVVFILLITVIDYNVNPFIKIVINLTTLSVLYWFLIVKLKFSDDINSWIVKLRRN